MAQTHKQKDGHRENMTESAQWGRFSENLALYDVSHMTYIIPCEMFNWNPLKCWSTTWHEGWSRGFKWNLSLKL